MKFYYIKRELCYWNSIADVMEFHDITSIFVTRHDEILFHYHNSFTGHKRILFCYQNLLFNGIPLGYQHSITRILFTGISLHYIIRIPLCYQEYVVLQEFSYHNSIVLLYQNTLMLLEFHNITRTLLCNVTGNLLYYINRILLYYQIQSL